MPGAVVAVVADGQLLFEKGYGVSDLDSRATMSPLLTVVRVASTSKLFTATAVMQQVDRGALRLDADINPFLHDLHVPEAFGTSLTLRQLLTHTAGLDERFLGIVVREESELLPLGRYLQHRLPDRVIPPGRVTSYSNHGVALAGYAVESVSGQPFARYMQDHVLGPLNMTHSAFDLPQPLRAALATGYEMHRGHLTRAPVDFVQTGPASSLVTTADDMTHFLIAQLDGGRYQGQPILSAASVTEMQRRQFSNHPALAGFGLAFFEGFRNGHRTLTHGGEIRGFDSLFCIIPDSRLGFFVNYNRNGSDVATDFYERFVDRLAPTIPSAEPPIITPVTTGDLSAYAGLYRMNRYPRSSFMKMGSFLGDFAQEYRVIERGPSTLETRPLFWSRTATEQWRRTADTVFQNVRGNDKIAFATAGGAPAHSLFRDSLSEAAFDRIPWYQSMTLHAAVMGGVLVFFLVALVVFATTHFRRPRRPNTLSSWAAMGVGVAYLGFFAALGLLLVVRPPVELVYGVPLVLKAILLLPLVSAALTLTLAIGLGAESRRLSARSKLYFSTTLLASLACLAILHHWSLLGLHYG